MTPTRALIEAAEEAAQWLQYNSTPTGLIERFEAAIASAKAAEEGNVPGMGKDEALAKALALWGDKGTVHDATAHDSDCFQVGLTYKHGIWVIGWGRTWEQAFENALTKPNPLPPTVIEVREKEGLRGDSKQA